jgi:hypothetical protein
LIAGAARAQRVAGRTAMAAARKFPDFLIFLDFPGLSNFPDFPELSGFLYLPDFPINAIS